MAGIGKWTRLGDNHALITRRLNGRIETKSTGAQAESARQPAEVGKQAIQASNERQTANKSFKVLSYVPETKDFTFLDGGWAVEWRTYTASYVDSPGGEAKQVRGTVLMVWKKLPDGSWKCFRAMGSMEPGTPAKAGGL